MLRDLFPTWPKKKGCRKKDQGDGRWTERRGGFFGIISKRKKKPPLPQGSPKKTPPHPHSLVCLVVKNHPYIPFL